MVEYVPGRRNLTADCLSRLPASPAGASEVEVDLVLSVDLFKPVDKKQWLAALSDDLDLSEVMKYVVSGWPREKSLSKCLQILWKVRDSLSVVDGVLMRGHQLVVPGALRRILLSFSHEGHPGISASKRKIRELYWWPYCDREVDESVRLCHSCILADKNKRCVVQPLTPLPVPKRAWNWLGIDIIGPINTLSSVPRFGIVVVDMFSRWPEVKMCSKVDTAAVISFLSSLFIREGSPQVLLSDNGVQFISREMRVFLESWGVVHKFSSVYHPQTNGLVERFNRVLKDALQLTVSSGLNWDVELDKLLWSCRSCPSTVSGVSPFSLMRGRAAVSKLNPAWVPRLSGSTSLDVVSRRQDDYVASYSSKFNVKNRTAVLDVKVGDFVRIRKPGLVRKGLSKFSSPKKVIKVARTCVWVEGGVCWNKGVLLPVSAGMEEVCVEDMQSLLHDSTVGLESCVDEVDVSTCAAEDSSMLSSTAAALPGESSSSSERQDGSESELHSSGRCPSTRVSCKPRWMDDFVC